jgi:hypothetical protein
MLCFFFIWIGLYNKLVVLHETVNEMHRKKLDGVLFKIDFEKAYDKVKWPFLQQVLRIKGLILFGATE